MSLVKVYTDVGLKKPVILIAKICKQSPKKKYHIKYLSPTDSKYNGKRVYNYENILYEIDDTSISEYLDTENEKDIGYLKIDDGSGFIKMSDIDADYEPSESSDDDESESESLVDEEDEIENDDDDDEAEEDFTDDDGAE